MGFTSLTNVCLICFEELELDMVVFFRNCSHGFCKHCALKIMMHKQYPYIECPVDHVNSSEIFHYNRGQCIQYLFVNESTHDYIKHSLEEEPEFFTENMEKELSHCILLCNDAIRYFTLKLNIFKTTLIEANKVILTKHTENNNDNKMEIYNKIQELDDKLNKKVQHLKEVNFQQSTKCDILLEFIDDKNEKGDPLFEVNNLICILLQQYLIVFKNFISEHFRNFNEPDIFTNVFYTNSIVAVDKELTTMKDMSLFLTMISVSYLDDSKSLYQTLQPQANKIDFQTCLICVKKIHGTHYGKFSKCHHKLCMSCIKSLYISEAHCPLEDDLTNSLEIVSAVHKIDALLHHSTDELEDSCALKFKNPFQYLLKKFEKYSVKNFDELFIYITQRIKEIKLVLVDSLQLLWKLQALIKQITQPYPDREVVNSIKLDITNLLKNTENKKFRYNDTITLMKFHGLLACYRIMDTKCRKCHTFDRILDQRIEEFMITLKELVLYKTWLSNFEHLIDVVTHYVNKPDLKDHTDKLQTISYDFIQNFDMLFNSRFDPAEEHQQFVSKTHNCHALHTFIEAKHELDKTFAKHKEEFVTLKVNCDSQYN